MSSDEKTPTIGDVKTFSAKVQTENLDSALEKFLGRRTIRTVQAARRIAATNRDVKIPRNLMRQLFRLTGGFKQEHLVAPKNDPFKDYNYYMKNDYNPIAIKLGDLEVVFFEDDKRRLKTNYGPLAWLFFRGKLVARTSGNNYCWLDDNRVSGAVHSLGVKFTLLS